MRIIGGLYKGRNIIAPKQLPVRPTTDFAKEGLFNVLTHRLDFSDLVVLDLFAGTGNISYEFASRGAQEIIAVDESYACIQFIQKTCQQFKIPTIKAFKSTAHNFLKNNTRAFPLIFADPPFDFESYPELLAVIVENQLVPHHALFVLEHHERLDFSDHPHFLEERKYGSIRFSFFQVT